MAPSLQSFQFAISCLTVLVFFAVAFVLHKRGLSASYRFFIAGLIVEALALLGMLVTRTSPKIYVKVYATAQPILCIFYVLMVVEVFRKVFAAYPGIARFAQRVIIISMVLAFVVAIASTTGETNHLMRESTQMEMYSVGFRAVTSALSLYLILIAAFLVWMPVPLPPNTIRHSFLFFFYFISTTSVHYILNVVGKTFVYRANLILSIVTLLVALCWLFLLKPDGEMTPKSPAKPKASADALLSRLESINKSLSPPEE